MIIKSDKTLLEVVVEAMLSGILYDSAFGTGSVPLLTQGRGDTPVIQSPTTGVLYMLKFNRNVDAWGLDCLNAPRDRAGNIVIAHDCRTTILTTSLIKEEYDKKRPRTLLEYVKELKVYLNGVWKMHGHSLYFWPQGSIEFKVYALNQGMVVNPDSIVVVIDGIYKEYSPND